METRKISVSTLFAFNEEARRQVEEQYEMTHPARTVLKGSRPTQFTLESDIADNTALQTFLEIVQRFISKEDGDGPQVENIHALRVKGTYPVIDDDINSDFENSSSDDAEHVTLSHADFPYVKRWHGDMVTHLARAIGDLTHCHIEQNLCTSGMLVRGKHMEDVDRAVCKLDTIYNSIQQQATFPIIHNFQISEGETNIALQLVSLKSLSDGRLTTTLVPSKLSSKLGSQLIVVMMKNGQVYPDHTSTVRAAKRSSNHESLLWKDVLYATLGLPEPSATKKARPEPAIVKAKHQTLSEWIDESSAALSTALDPFVPLPDEHGPSNVAVDDHSARPADPSNGVHVSPKKRPIKVRKAKGAVPTEYYEAVPLDDNLQAEMPKPVEDHNEAVGQLLVPAEPKIATYINGSPESNKAEKPTTSGTYMDDLWSLQLVEGPQIQPPYLPARSTTSGTTSITKYDSHWSYERVSSVKEGRLIDISGPDRPQEQIQKANTNRQKPKNTMRQCKAPSSKAFNDGQAATLKQYDDFMSRLLACSKSNKGQVKLEVKFGRLMIEYDSGTTDYKKIPFAVGQWHLAFPNKAEDVRLQSFITERLTVLGSDVDFMLQLKTPSKRNMFTPEPCERTTFYRFNCISKQTIDREFTIDIYEDKTFGYRDASVLVGALDMHFTKRYWDARIAVTTASSLIDILGIDNVDSLTRYLVDNFSVSPSASAGYLNLHTKLNDKNVGLQSIEVHRQTRHTSVNYPDLLLKLSEVQDLCFEHTDEANCHAWTLAKKDMAADGRLWWEVSLASRTAENILKGNETLELGDTANWEPKDIVEKGVIREMSHLARDIVTRIDSVGQQNKGPKTGSSKEESEKAIQNLGFW